MIDSDDFSFRLELKDTPLTRRGNLSTVNSIYDPLELESRILLQGKQILKQMYELGKNWMMICQMTLGWNGKNGEHESSLYEMSHSRDV